MGVSLGRGKHIEPIVVFRCPFGSSGLCLLSNLYSTAVKIMWERSIACDTVVTPHHHRHRHLL